MAVYTARWLAIALEQYAALPAAARQQVQDRVAQLLEHLEGPPQAYDPPTDQWTTTYGGGGGGLILYAVVQPHRKVLILRLV